MNWYQKGIEDTLAELSTSAKGLPDAEVESRQEEYGPNAFRAAKERSKFSIFAEQFKDVMIVILIIAAIISFVSGEATDAIVILAIIIGNAVIGYFQEYNAEKSVRMLQKMTAQKTVVIRNGMPREVEARTLVPGDIVVLEAGNIVPADARLIEVSALKTEEAALTGESHSVMKKTAVIETGDILPGDQLNMVFKGTIISNGTGKAVVTATGMDTEMGRIAEMLDVGPQKTPLQVRLAKFSKQLAVIVIVICALVFGFGILRGEPALNIFLTAISLAVAALPEALPAVITIALARGAERMVKQKALIRKLPAVETLGSVTYICSDKTGTLTLNKMTVEHTRAVDGMEQMLLYNMMLNNEVRLSDDGTLLGDSTEIALVEYAVERGIDFRELIIKYPRIDDIPFDSDRMVMSTLHRAGNRWLLLVKGAPVKIIERLSSSYTEQQKQEWILLNRKWAADGIRVLFFAYRYFDEKPVLTPDIAEVELEMQGAVGMIDPPRREVIDAIRQCKNAGIRTVMITGDQPVTAKAIARELDIINDEGQVLTGADLKTMDDASFKEKVENISVYARVSPEQKLNIVKALQENKQYVAMTGDGVNDAPSLKQANIGVAMGVTGTDVAKEAAHMILLDDNFSTIVRAVREGRRIYDNIRKFILYILACNLGEILVIALAPLFGLAIPLLPIHILWINLVTDGLPGIALATEPAERNIMRRPPRPPQESIFAGGMLYRIGFTGVILAVASLGTQYWADYNEYSLAAQQTMVFTVLCFAQLANALSVRSAYRPILTMSLFSNPLMVGSVALTVLLQFAIIYIPQLHSIFKTITLESTGIIAVFVATLSSLLLIEIYKWLFRRQGEGSF